MKMRPVFSICILALHMGSSYGFQTISRINRKSHSDARSCRFSCLNALKIRNNFVGREVKLRATNRPGDREEPDKTLSFQRSDNGTRDSEFWVDRSSGNPFYEVISALTPGELVGQFINSASPRVQASLYAIYTFLHEIRCDSMVY